MGGCEGPGLYQQHSSPRRSLLVVKKSSWLINMVSKDLLPWARVMRLYHIEVTVLTRSGTNKFKRQKKNSFITDKKVFAIFVFLPWNAIVGKRYPGQMRSSRKTHVSTRRSALHASVASFFCVICYKVRLQSSSLFLILQREWVRVTLTGRYGWCEVAYARWPDVMVRGAKH